MWIRPVFVALLIGLASSLTLFTSRESDGEAAPQITEEKVVNRVYLFWMNGEFLVVELPDLTIAARWYLSGIDELAEVLRPYVPPNARYVGGMWSPHHFQINRSSHRLYGVFPAAAKGKVILVLQLPRMKLIGSIELPENMSGSPALLLTPDGKELLVSYGMKRQTSASPLRSTLDIYDASSLKLLHRLNESEEINPRAYWTPQLNGSFSENAYFSTDGKTIYDRDKRITRDQTEFTRERLNAKKGLSPSQLKQLEPFMRIDRVGKKRLPMYGVKDSKAGRTLVVTAKKGQSNIAMWTVDMKSAKLSPVIVGPSSDIHLTLDGMKILLEERRAFKEPNGAVRYDKTGRFLLYEVHTGKKLREFNRPLLAGSSAGMICFTPDSKSMFYAVKGSLYFVSLVQDTPPKKIPSAFSALLSTHCVFD